MNKKWKIFLTVLALGFVSMVIWVVKTTPDSPPPIEKVEIPKTMEYEGNTISEEKNGVKLWDLTADKIVVGIETQVADLKNVTAHYYNPDGRSIEIKSSIGVYNNVNRNVHLEGKVKIATSEGAELTADKLDWLFDEALLTATGKVKIVRDDVIATGDIAESYDGFQKFKMKGKVHIVKESTNE